MGRYIPDCTVFQDIENPKEYIVLSEKKEDKFHVSSNMKCKRTDGISCA